MTYNWFLTGLWWLSEVLPSCQEGFNSQTLGALNKNTAAKTANTTTTSWARTLLTSNGRSFIIGSVFIVVTWENKQDYKTEDAFYDLNLILLFEACVNCNAKRTTHNTNNKTFSFNEMQMKGQGILQFSEFMNWPTFKFPKHFLTRSALGPLSPPYWMVFVPNMVMITLYVLNAFSNWPIGKRLG